MTMDKDIELAQSQSPAMAAAEREKLLRDIVMKGATPGAVRAQLGRFGF